MPVTNQIRHPISTTPRTRISHQTLDNHGSHLKTPLRQTRQYTVTGRRPTATDTSQISPHDKHVARQPIVIPPATPNTQNQPGKPASPPLQPQQTPSDHDHGSPPHCAKSQPKPAASPTPGSSKATSWRRLRKLRINGQKPPRLHAIALHQQNPIRTITGRQVMARSLTLPPLVKGLRTDPIRHRTTNSHSRYQNH